MAGFPGGSDGKESAGSAGDLGSIPGSGRSPGEGNGYPFQYSGLENSMDRGYSPWGRKELDTTERLTYFCDMIYIKHLAQCFVLSRFLINSISCYLLIY